MPEHLTPEELRRRFEQMHGAVLNSETLQVEPKFITGADLQSVALQITSCLEGVKAELDEVRARLEESP